MAAAEFGIRPWEWDLLQIWTAWRFVLTCQAIIKQRAKANDAAGHEAAERRSRAAELAAELGQ